MSRHYGMMDPSGRYHEVAERTHAVWALNHKDRVGCESSDPDEALDAFLVAGWIRVTPAGVQVASLSKGNVEQVKKIIATRAHAEPWGPFWVEELGGRLHRIDVTAHGRPSFDILDLVVSGNERKGRF